MEKRRLLAAAAAVFAGLPASAPKAAGYSYSFITVAGGSNVNPTGINDSGQVTGSYGDASGNTQGFLRSAAGAVTTFSYPGQKSTVPNGINASGLVVGYFATLSGTPQDEGFTYQDGVFAAADINDSSVTQFGKDNADGQVTATFSTAKTGHTSAVYHGGKVGPYFGKPQAFLTGINASGEISGYETATGSNTQAFTYIKGTLTVLPVAKTPRTQATGLNDGGTVVGFLQAPSGDVEGFIDTAGTVSYLTYPGEANTEPEGVNAGGTVIGNADPGNILMTVAFSYGGGTFTQINPPGCASSVLLKAINTSGEVIGQCEQSGSGGFVGFVATPD